MIPLFPPPSFAGPAPRPLQPSFLRRAESLPPFVRPTPRSLSEKAGSRAFQKFSAHADHHSSYSCPMQSANRTVLGGSGHISRWQNSSEVALGLALVEVRIRWADTWLQPDVTVAGNLRRGEPTMDSKVTDPPRREPLGTLAASAFTGHFSRPGRVFSHEKPSSKAK